MSYKDKIVHVSGKKGKEVFLFALSTCPWCKKTKKLLKDLGLEYGYVDVDLLEGEDKEEALKEMARHREQSFPLIIIDKKKTIHGFDEEKIREYCG